MLEHKENELGGIHKGYPIFGQVGRFMKIGYELHKIAFSIGKNQIWVGGWVKKWLKKLDILYGWPLERE